MLWLREVGIMTITSETFILRASGVCFLLLCNFQKLEGKRGFFDFGRSDVRLCAQNIKIGDLFFLKILTKKE